VPQVTADAIDAILPQTQCTKCGYGGCRPYAEALAEGAAEINRCPPGGAEGIEALADLLGRAALPLDPGCGVERPPSVARIVEADCIGCAKCILACPVDAIVGAAKLMHTVLSEECTGCELCIAPCPVDCIVMEPVARPQRDPVRATHARRRYEARNARRARLEAERIARLESRQP
jgi:electron transport complex protein RnfB